MGEHKKVVMFPNKDPNLQQICCCPACGFATFAEAWQLRQTPGIISRSGSPERMKVGPMYVCLNAACGKISHADAMILKSREEYVEWHEAKTQTENAG